MRKLAFLSLCMIVFVLSATVSAQRPEPKETEVMGHTMYTLMEPGGIPAIFNPEFVSIEIADSFYYDDEPLMIVVSGGIARGYSTWHLDHHEVVNDYVGSQAITITW